MVVMASEYRMLEDASGGARASAKPRGHHVNLAALLLVLMLLSCAVHRHFFSTADAGPADLVQTRPETDIPSTVEGPFAPRTVPFDGTLTLGSEDLNGSNPRVVRTATGMEPEQIFLALSTPDAMWVSWVTGEAQIGQNVEPLDPSSVASVVVYGTGTNRYTDSVNGTSEIYNQLYPFEGLDNYTSGIIHHVRMTGLEPDTLYFYRVGDPYLGSMSDEHFFTTMPAPGPASFPTRIGVIGDIGLTYNSTSTFDHLVQNRPDLVLMVGDLTYADLYVTNGTGSSSYSQTFPDTPIHETYQPRWDLWGRFMEPLTSSVPFMVIEGNHEKEPQMDNRTFASYQARFAVPFKESGSPNSFYYSFDAGGIHFLMLGAYTDYSQSSAQYAWLERDLANVNRSVTPWLIATWHPPWYNSYTAHYREVECMRMSMEDLLYQNGVDLVLNGHIHAYERMNRVYNYTLDDCGPVHITIGDGGNHEKIALKHADDEPGLCPDISSTGDDFGTCGFNFDSGPAAGRFCWQSQPEWSAYREASFGHGIIEVINSTHLLWTWHRNQDLFSGVGDQLYIVRQPGICFNQSFE
ncbi:acid phosphatase type 7 [Marchantia polymorpha subsp. ruderalis]